MCNQKYNKRVYLSLFIFNLLTILTVIVLIIILVTYQKLGKIGTSNSLYVNAALDILLCSKDYYQYKLQFNNCYLSGVFVLLMSGAIIGLLMLPFKINLIQI